jgi:hypothetical protein
MNFKERVTFNSPLYTTETKNSNRKMIHGAKTLHPINITFYSLLLAAISA